MEDSQDREKIFTVFEGVIGEKEIDILGIYHDPDEAIRSCVEEGFLFLGSEETWIRPVIGLSFSPEIYWRKIVKNYISVEEEVESNSGGKDVHKEKRNKLGKEAG